MRSTSIVPVGPHPLFALLMHLGHKMQQRVESAPIPFGLRPRHVIAMTMLRERGPQSQQALAAMLQVDPTNLVGLLNDLEAHHLIQRVRSPEDRRRHIVQLTPAGHGALTEAEDALDAAERDVFAALDVEQRHQLYSLLQLAGTNVVTVPTQDE
jgi:DNA-binding MarR family transcriptional regulator